MSYLLAVDQGTSSTRAMVYGLDGKLVASSQMALTQSYPQPGWVEQDPEEIWQATLTVLRDVLAQSSGNQIIACGITNQRETTVIWDKRTGECIAPAIVWQDRRTQDFCQSLSTHTPMIQQKTGLVPDSYFSASKLHWLLQHCERAKALALKGDLAFGTIDSFLIWRMTKGSHLTDTTNASRTLLFNIFSQDWDDELLALFKIPASVLPTVQASDSHFGLIHKDILGFEIPITGVAGDQHAALIGQGCFKEGMVKATFGTGGFLLLNTGELPIISKHKLLTTIAYKIKNRVVYGLEGSIYHAGTTIKWLRDEMKLLRSSAESEELAKSLSANGGVYLISSFTGLGAPHWLSTTGAVITGLSRITNRAHFARAALEGVCYQTPDVLHCMREDSQIDLSTLRADGGMAGNNWFLQFMANQCQLAVERPADVETTAKGAAILAGLGSGVFISCEDIGALDPYETVFKVTETKEQVESDYQGWLSALEKLKH